MTRHVGVTGTRTGGTPDQLARLEEILGNLFETGGTHLHVGDCVGLDEQAHIIAWSVGFHIVMHPPSDPKLRAFMDRTQYWGRDDVILPPKPYLMRNKDIVDASALLLVVPGETTEQVRSGTWSTWRHARKAGVPSRLILPNPVPSKT